MTSDQTPIERAAEAIEDNTGLAGIIDSDGLARAVFDSIDVDVLARVLCPPRDGACEFHLARAHLVKEWLLGGAS